ncbi:MAG: universal stress protein [Nitrospirae bacterium]|nr:universal stress protein [Candidatus Manganitrophaceae bacterium]
MKFLICTDGEEYAEAAIRFGGRLAKEMNADVGVLHVRRPISSSERVQLTTTRKKLTAWDLDIPGVEYLTRARELLDEVGFTEAPPAKEKVSLAFREGIGGATEIHLVGAPGEQVHLRLREGDPVEQILEEARTGDYDMIILGSHGQPQGVSGYFIGSTALRVADLAACSVLIAKNIRRDHDFLLCTDGSLLAEKAEIAGAEMARVIGARVTILSVAEEEVDREEALQRARRAEMILAQMGIEATSKVRVGRPSQEIIAEAMDHDIVVLGASGRSAVKKFFLGSVPLKVMEYGECPVVIVREKRGKIPLHVEATEGPSVTK